MDKIEIKGRVNTAICYAKVVEDEMKWPFRILSA